MSNIDTRANFFPRSRSAQAEKARSQSQVGIAGTQAYADPYSIQEGGSSDARVSIPDGVKDFSRIKRAVDQSPDVDNSEKIARLKAQIQAGEYNVDYDAVADKMLQTEF
jgi:negative regulator of flagellin synthesis FlgM